MRTVEPVVLRASSWRCASAASLKREALADLDPHLARADDVEQVAGGLLELVARGDVVEQGRPGQEQRPLLREQSRRESDRAGPTHCR